jgi:hypothetical protein
MKKRINPKHRTEYSALKNAIYRCNNTKHPQYEDYGGRGIKVDPVFMDPITGFDAFLADVGTKPSRDLSLDRISNDLGYAPGNLKWSTRSEQQANRRAKQEHVKDFGWGFKPYIVKRRDGVAITRYSPLVPLADRVLSLKEWEDELGVSQRTLRQRLQRGWTPEQTFVATIFNPRGTPRKF